MIARMWRGRTRAADRDRYLEYLRRTGFPEYAATQGNRGLLAFRRIDGDEAEFLLVTLWDSFDAVRRFAGADPERAKYYPEDGAYLLEMDPHVTHFELVAEERPEPGGRSRPSDSYARARSALERQKNPGG